MKILKILALFAGLALLGACGQSKFQSYDGPEVTRVVILKEQRSMYLLSGDQTLKSYPIGLGFAPVGHKQVEGDGRTPEGHYRIDRRNPNSRYYLSIGISYPDPDDIARARALGRPPGGDIFIHGTPKAFRNRGRDWTWGCISVTDPHMEEIYAMVKNGTVVSIYP